MLIKILISIWLLPGIYQYNLSDIDGGTISMSAYQGKKIMIVTLPVIEDSASDAWLGSLDSLASVHLDSLTVIGIPSYEDGFAASNRAALSLWYKTKLGNHVTVSDGVYTHSGSGEQQNELFRWLTHSDMNETFSIDPQSPGYKFFVNPDGTLYAVMHPLTNLGSRIIDKLIHQ